MHMDPDTQLMMNVKAGDTEAFKLLFDKYKKQVVTYCYRYCGHPLVAEELAQETFLRVYKAAAGYRPKSRFSTWLYKIATNVCLNEIRKPVYKTKMESIDLFSESNSVSRQTTPDTARPDALLQKHQQQHMIRKAMGQLPEEQRAALLLRVTEEFSYQEIGKQIQCSENHVKTLIFRARQKMKKILGSYREQTDD